ncbi:hypothetical protein QQ045_000048 [Rhodiola kirilowii]
MVTLFVPVFPSQILARIMLKEMLLLALISLQTCISYSADPLVQQQLDKIDDHLPGQSFNISFSHYSGYVTVDEESGRSLFYWLTESAEDPSSKPLVLWLNGGPGCSSIAYGEAEEIGPFHIKADGKTLYLNQYAWNHGHYVPQLSQAIVKHNSATNDTSINLKGYMVGNALTDDFYDHLGLFEFVWSIGLISDETYHKLNKTCVEESFIHTSIECLEVLQNANLEIGNVDPYSIFTPPCSGNHFSSNRLMKSLIGRISDMYDPCTADHSRVYFNLAEVRQALHVHPDAAQPSWDTCNSIVNVNWGDCPSSMLDVYHELIDAGLRIWVFSGDTDAVIPVTATRYSVGALNLKTSSPLLIYIAHGGALNNCLQACTPTMNKAQEHMA